MKEVKVKYVREAFASGKAMILRLLTDHSVHDCGKAAGISGGAFPGVQFGVLPSNAGARLIGCAGDFLFECSPAWAYPLPESGMIRFYLLTFDGVMTTEAPMRELASGMHPLS